MKKALKASLSANKMTFDEQQLGDLVEALWEDAGLWNKNDLLDLASFKALLESHEGLAEGLNKSITGLILPPIKKKVVKARSRRTNLKSYIKSNVQLLSFLWIVILANVVLFVTRMIQFSEFRNWDGSFNPMFMFSRANGMCLNLNAALVLTMVILWSGGAEATGAERNI